MFAKAILKLPELPSDPKDGRVYDLNSLRQKSFDFVYDVGKWHTERGDKEAETVVEGQERRTVSRWKPMCRAIPMRL